MFLQSVMLSFRALWRNKLRSCLTVLGIVIGVSSVISVVVIGQGASRKLTNEISSLGSRMIIITPEEENGVGFAGETTNIVPFKNADVETLKREFPDCLGVAPVTESAVVAVYGNNNCRTAVTGTESSYFMIRKWEASSGRFFSPREEKAGKSVCIIGEKVSKTLFKGLDPVGNSVRIDRFAYQVVGVLKSKGGSMVGKEQDDVILVPLKLFQRRISGNKDVDMILVGSGPGQDSTSLKMQLKQVMKELRPVPTGHGNNFTIEDMKEIIRTVKKQTSVFTTFISAIAAISLLVGGIGIMNIMLVSVTERTREIGIRLAVGAQERDILYQFLVEAVVLSLFGGLVGIILGLVIPLFVTGYMKIPFVIDLRIILISFVFSGFVGIVFGYFPARRAARMNPIDALRHE
ncbi:ABC transporter permease [Desulfovibrio sp. JC010]|uniref:ABC transporter permease n=1 Tax=Desulfovibrio sp. JC010 TaxID=2593641 RepID=UPI0013D88A54|nr:ABC transporter permease [Desulfovibrio sp. JC010]NDV28869.1 FtsX-like permease family protein [Desulfovibrio sp. JC010]